MISTKTQQTTIPALVAHRGASHRAPENTMESFRLAWLEQATRVEGDFWMTADGEIICIHDPTTIRTAPQNPPVDVRTITYDQLISYDVGSWKAEEYKNARIPKLSEILAEVPASTMIYIEIKQNTPKIISRLMEEIAASPVRLEQVTLISFSTAIVKLTKEMATELKVLLLYDIDGEDEEKAGGVALEELPQFVQALGADGLDIGKNAMIDDRLIKALRTYGLEFHVWTVNALDDALKYIELGVDSITTDRPQGLREEIEAYFK